MRTNPFKYVNTKGPLKSVMIYGMIPILESIYKPQENRWAPKDEPIMGKNGPWHPYGVYDFNQKTNKFEWSGLNFFNTNYSMCYEALLFLEEKNVFIGFSDDDTDEDIKIRLKMFLKELDKRKMEFFFDGTIKDILNGIHAGTWKRGENHSDNIKTNYKNIWPESIDFNDNNGEKGMLNDMINGIDGTIIYESKVETTQIKGCKKIEKIGNKYYVYCVVDYSKYGNITYFCFYPNNENKFYVFNNDKDKIESLFENNETMFVLDESLLHYIGNK